MKTPIDWTDRLMAAVFDDPPQSHRTRRDVAARAKRALPELLELCTRYYVGDDHLEVSRQFASLQGYLETGERTPVSW